jgi:hypothetical protein
LNELSFGMKLRSMRNDINPNSKILAKKETTMKMTTLVKASMFAATLGFISMLAPAARAQADAMPNPDEFPFEAPQATAAEPVQIAAAQVANADFEGKVSLPFNVKCGATNLKAGQYLLSVKSQGSSRVVTLRSAGQNMTMRVHEVSAHRGANQSALLVRKSGEGRRLEAVYVAGLNATLYLNPSSDEPHTRMEHLPIS